MQTPRTKISALLAAAEPVGDVRAKGWARTVRDSKQVLFIELNDGSSFGGLQVVVPAELDGFAELRKLTTGSAVEVVGDLVESPAKGQRFELAAKSVQVIGRADDSYPLQKKRHGFDFLRTIAHLRVRTNTFGAVFRIRSRLAQAVHEFFRARGFFYVHTPIITASDCEGAGEMFQVTTMDLEHVAKNSIERLDYKFDFFDRPSYLTVSGQLEAELGAM
ncbi:MAG: OB-fold nucleic acid binding domain-containing protein, partial [Nannocystaceae bacterium]